MLADDKRDGTRQMSRHNHTLISLALMTTLFNVKSQTIYRWHSSTDDRPKMLPEPDIHVGRTPLWWEDTILAWAEGRGLQVNEAALNQIRAAQVRTPVRT